MSSRGSLGNTVSKLKRPCVTTAGKEKRGAGGPPVPASEPLPVPSGQQEPVRGTGALAVRLRALPVAATAATLHLPGLQAAGSPAPLPGHRPDASDLHTLSLIKPYCQPAPRASRLASPARPGDRPPTVPTHSLGVSPPASAAELYSPLVPASACSGLLRPLSSRLGRVPRAQQA